MSPPDGFASHDPAAELAYAATALGAPADGPDEDADAYPLPAPWWLGTEGAGGAPLA